MAINPGTLEFQSATRAGTNNPPVTSIYSVNFSSGGQDYTFVPDSVINKGVKSGDNTYVMPWFLNKENLGQLGKASQKVDLAGQSWYGDWLKDNVGASTTGFLFPTGSVPFDGEIRTFPTSQGEVKGIAEKDGQLVYTQAAGNNQTKYLGSDGTIHTTTYTPGRSWLGDTFGGVGDAMADFINSDVGKLTMVAAAAYAGGAFDPSSAAATGGNVASGEALSGIDLGGIGASPNTLLGAGEYATSVPTISDLAASYYGVPVGSEYVPPVVTELGTVAGPTTGMANGTALSDVGTGEALSGIDLGGVGASPNTWMGAGEYAAAVPAAIAGAGMIPGAIGGAAAGTLTGSALGDMAAINAGAGLIGGTLQSNAAKEAAQIQAAAADRAIAALQKNFETINAQQAPYRAAGYNSLNNIAGLTSGQTPQYDSSGNIVKDANGNPVMTTGSGYLQHQFDASDLAKGLAPNYDFMLQQGQMANQRAANMGGGALGGNALQGLNKYTQDYAGNAYQNAFTNYQNQRSNIYNTLASIAGIGQTGQNATNTAATNATNASTQLGVGSAAANAAATTGSANAYTNAINNATNNYTLASLLNQSGRVA